MDRTFDLTKIVPRIVGNFISCTFFTHENLERTCLPVKEKGSDAPRNLIRIYVCKSLCARGSQTCPSRLAWHKHIHTHWLKWPSLRGEGRSKQLFAGIHYDVGTHKRRFFRETCKRDFSNGRARSETFQKYTSERINTMTEDEAN